MPRPLVDIHCHGALGHEFGMSGAGSRTAAEYHRTAGSDAVVASLVSATPADLEARVRVLAPLVADGTLAGIHLEGPFLALSRCGAHDPAVLAAPNVDLVSRLTRVAAESGAPGAIRHWTYAPELPGAREFVEALVAAGIRPSVGHTDGAAEVVDRALARTADLTGAPALVTHLFNGMPAFHHRSGGPVAAALAAAGRGEARVELIADGHHLGPDVVRMVFETVGPDAIVLVSDAMAATGLGDGAYRIGSLDVGVVEGVARLAGGDGPGAIAGSTATLADCVRWCVDVVGLPEADVVAAASWDPQQLFAVAS